ncbi:hypothetical protein K3495_g16113, partial [Podosphaera aphanis]
MYVNAKIGNDTLVALVDTGASGLAFASQSLCDRLSLPLQTLKSSVALVGFEGKQGSRVAHETSFSLDLGNHRENLSAYVIPFSKYDLVLGLPWLEKHAPFIDWKEHTITFGEPCLESSCCEFETTIPYHNSRLQTLREKGKPPPQPKAEILPPTMPKPLQISAAAFSAASRQTGSTYFALSLRDLDVMIDDSPPRLPSFHMGNAIMVIPKNAEPKEFLPPQYHDFLDVFDKRQANALPPHRSWDHPIDLQPGKQPP